MTVVRWGLVLAALALVGCGGDASGTGGGRTQTGGGGGGAGTGTGGTGGDGVCASALLCGSPAVCCAIGEECLEGTCVPGCASGIRCGSNGSVCCETGEVCLAEACAAPRASCIDSFDCEEGEFCEPTLDRCLPQPEGPLCELRPENLTFEPVVEWHWQGWDEDPDKEPKDRAFRHVQSTPAIADIDNDGLPEVVTVAYRGEGENSDNMLIVLNGEDGSEYLTIPVSRYNVAWGTGAAVGNMDDDPELEIVFMTASRKLVVIEHDGTEKWAADLSGNGKGYPALANLDDDPEPEVIIGGQWFDNDGTLLHDGGWIGTNNEWSISAVADMDGDGRPDIVGGNVVYRADGTKLWERDDLSDGFVAVADMDGDTHPDVVTISYGEARVLRGIDGTSIFGPVAIPGGTDRNFGGAPTVADFDGDGRPEFATAGKGNYVVFDLDCTESGDPVFCVNPEAEGILWLKDNVQDKSSSVTGSSVFDFEGDGKAEVVYNDECHLYILNGEDGTELLKLENSSRTAAEYPLIVDVDADGNSEFVVSANNDKIGRDCDNSSEVYDEIFGLYAYGDLNDKWVRTRQVWNQHTYHVTNVEGSGTIPEVEDDSWSATGLNNYRQNVQGTGIFNAPDLTVLGLSISARSCPASIDIQAQIGNTGSLGVQAGVPVGFYQGTPPDGVLLGFEETSVALLPGQSETLVRTFSPPSEDLGPWDFYVMVDDEAAGLSLTLECGEDNNQGSIGAAECIVVL